jgi:hypothetical protein
MQSQSFISTHAQRTAVNCLYYFGWTVLLILRLCLFSRFDTSWSIEELILKKSRQKAFRYPAFLQTRNAKVDLYLLFRFIGSLPCWNLMVDNGYNVKSDLCVEYSVLFAALSALLAAIINASANKINVPFLIVCLLPVTGFWYILWHPFTVTGLYKYLPAGSTACNSCYLYNQWMR